MKRGTWMVFAGLVACVAAMGQAVDSVAAPTLTAFDHDVAVCRRVVREYCAIAQGMGSASTIDQEKQAEGLRLLVEAQKQWTEIKARYAQNPPAEYAKDMAFSMRLRDVEVALDDMTRALAGGDARRSFMACGFACGLFVQMHEQNGLNYALDKLFHLRHDIRTTNAVMKSRGLDAVQARLAGLLQKRDAVLAAPPPFAPDDPKAAPYAAAVDDLSRAMDRLAIAVAAGDAGQAEEILSNGLMLVNKPYGIAL